jgi:homoserine O-acetyltransferase
VQRRRIWTIVFVLVFVASALCMRAQVSQQKFANLGQCKLENGQAIQDCRIGYRTFGTLNAARDNAVLMPTSLHGNTAEMTPLFGDGSSPLHFVDTTRFFGIAVDAFGNGISSSPSNSTAQHGTEFPHFTLRDCVRAQYRLATEVLHIQHLHAVTGISMGGEQTFVWAVMYPKYFDLAVPVLGTPRETSFDLLTKQIQIDAIKMAPGYDDGHYTTEPDLRLANLIDSLVVVTPQYRNKLTPRDEATAYIHGAETSDHADANDRLWQLEAVRQLDMIGDRTIAEAARAGGPHFLVIVSKYDHTVNPQPALDWAAAAGAPMYESQLPCGHSMMNCDAAAVSSRVRAFLAAGMLPKSDGQ